MTYDDVEVNQDNMVRRGKHGKGTKIPVHEFKGEDAYQFFSRLCDNHMPLTVLVNYHKKCIDARIQEVKEVDRLTDQNKTLQCKVDLLTDEKMTLQREVDCLKRKNGKLKDTNATLEEQVKKGMAGHKAATKNSKKHGGRN